MNKQMQQIRLNQLNRSWAAGSTLPPRPRLGWLRAVREALGLSLDQVGKKINETRMNVKRFEIWESNDRITLQNLRRVAAAMDCNLVYFVVPKTGTFSDLASAQSEFRRKVKESLIRKQAEVDVRAVEHTMALEDQASGNTQELIDQEVKRRMERLEKESRR